MPTTTSQDAADPVAVGRCSGPSRVPQANQSGRARARHITVERRCRRWHDEIRPSLHATNLRLQDVDPSTLDDDGLRAHIVELLEVLRDDFELHFWLHGHDLGPIARFLYSCQEWGLDPAEAIEALAGASPSTVKPRVRLARLRALVEASATPVVSLADVRAVSDEAAALLDEHVREHGHVLATGYDLTAKTLNELPEVLLAAIGTSNPAPTYGADALTGHFAGWCPASIATTSTGCCKMPAT